jgi:hypothetical protein
MNEASAAGLEKPATLIEFTGLYYIEVIGLLAQSLGARTYFEIGTSMGDSLAAVNCASLAVDPAFQVSKNVMTSKPACHLFQMESDKFFRDYRVTDFLKDGIDLAFLDGMHRFEYLLRDFLNTEVYCRRNSIILLHDCLPTTIEMTSRIETPNAWTGDVWKIIPALRKYRPDLKLVFLDCPPTGLVAITNLDPNPKSSILSDTYFSIVDEFKDQDARAGLADIFSTIDLIDSRELKQHDRLTRHFWL